MEEILWNIPEQKTGTLQVVSGHSGSFVTAIKLTEYLSQLPLKEVRLLLPDSLRGKLPPLPHIQFAPATTSGSLDKSPELSAALDDADLALIPGDLSKNSATAIAIADAIKNTARPVVLARDAVDLITPEASAIIDRPDLTIIASMAQLQKLFRALYYPKMLLLTMPLQPAIEVLHKFTLSYPCTILTLHESQIIVAHSGQTQLLPLSKTLYSPLSLWSGELASKVAALNLWTPTRPLDATFTAINWQP